MKLYEILSISASCLVILGIFYKQTRKIKERIEYQIRTLQQLKERMENLEKVGPRPLKDIKKKIEDNHNG